MLSKNMFLVIIASIVIIIAAVVWFLDSNPNTIITSFEECTQAGYPIMESYPPRCRTADGQLFTQDIGNEMEKGDLIRISSPRPNETVSRTLVISGEARGNWFFEALFPIRLQDLSGNTLATIVVQAEGEWMTTEFVPFHATLNIPDTFSGKAVLVLQKDNPSGLPEHDNSLRVPIVVR